MKKTLLGLLISATLFGCSMFEEDQTNGANNNGSANSEPYESSLAFQKQFSNRFYAEHKNSGVTVAENSSQIKQDNPGNRHNSSLHHNYDNQTKGNPISGAKHNINHYAQGLMQDLVANLQYVNSTTPLAVVSFVMLDSDYNQSNLLGNLIAESLVHEIHKFGIPVIDYKTTGFIRITENGDFAFSKDYEELGDSLAARYILGGTMVKHRDGFLVNARIVGLESKAVVATAQSFIPNSIAGALMVRENQGINEHSDSPMVKSSEAGNASQAPNRSTNRIALIAN